jgi:uncharacterized protein with von Willebrand factor type A (vWA) domain
MSQQITSRGGVLVARGTVIAVVMDRSGSMLACREEMISAFAQFIANQQDTPRSCLVSLYQFNDQFEAVYEGVTLEAVPPLTLEPAGGTALYDAIAAAVTATERTRPVKVIMVIITDGADNSSREFKGSRGAQQITSIIRRRKLEGWEFVFIGADLENIATTAGSRAMPFGSPKTALSSASELVLRKRGDRP